MVNYGNGKVYKIQRIGGNSNIYIGSTTKQYLSQRMDKHRSDYKQHKAGKRGLTTSFIIFDKYGIENCEIVLLESVNCNSKDELLKRERYYIENNDCVNIMVPGRTYKEYYEDNKDKIVEHRKKYYRENIDKIKDYRDKNKDKNKEYREKNKDKINAYQFAQCYCECGGKYIYKHKLRHMRSIKHKNYEK